MVVTPHSIGFDHAENRMHTSQAVLGAEGVVTATGLPA